MDLQPQTFDPREEFSIVERRLPHWSQAGAICFITFRTWDSMPAPVLDLWLARREQWLRDHGINPTVPQWKAEVEKLPSGTQRAFTDFVAERWDSHLDELHGACVLRQPRLAEIVADSLHHFDSDRYVLDTFVVMPNHVHLLAAFPSDDAQLVQCESWKHYTARQINRAVGRSGRFWQQDGFDHLVRSEEQLEQLRRYMADNPRRANLPAGQFIYYEAPRIPLA